MPRGFILQSTYRVESGRPVVHIHGVLEDGKSFLLRDSRQIPRFWVRAADAARAAQLGARIDRDAPLRRTMGDAEAVAVELDRPQEAPPLRDRLLASGIDCFEADVRFAYRYLIDRGIRGALEIRGQPVGGRGTDAIFEDPEVAPAEMTPQLSVLSFDIETDPGARRLLSVSLAGCGVEEVLLLTPEGYDCPAGAIPARSERALLRRFVERVREIDPDVLTGWNVVDFDLTVLLRMAERLGVRLALGRGEERLRLRPSGFARASNRAELPGRLVLDGIELLRGAFVRLESYSLNRAAREILGRTKTITGGDRAQEILRQFEEDRARLVEYNLNDSRLVLEILDKLQLVPLAVERSLLTGMPPDRVSASIASFDFLYLSQLSRRGIVAPTVRSQSDVSWAQSGGHVLEPRPGLYRNVLTLDFKSLYPSVIRTFNIDPLGRLPRGTPDDAAIVAPGGTAFRREPGILPGLLDELFPRRERAKREGDAVASQAIKILMNSFYGVLGTPACRFASPDLANAITGFGREILLWTKGRIESYGYEVLYGDTDSLFVLSGIDEEERAFAAGGQLVERLNGELAAEVRRRWQVESRLELEFEKLYVRLLLPAVRHGTAGARKRYAGVVRGSPEVVFTGMEVVRRDWTELAKRVQRELYARLFSDRAVDDYLRGVVEELREGKLDDLLVYRKALRRKLGSYTAATPPHVAAARKMRGRPGRVIAYVMTGDGPEPAAERQSPIDHEHYVQKQVRAVAEPVLTLLGLDFDRVVGDDTQMRLF